MVKLEFSVRLETAETSSLGTWLRKIATGFRVDLAGHSPQRVSHLNSISVDKHGRL